jgi:hypothetical protein
MGTNDEFIYHNTSCGVVKLNKGIPPGTLSFVPYEIIVPLGSTNTTPPERIAIGSPHFT